MDNKQFDLKQAYLDLLQREAKQAFELQQCQSLLEQCQHYKTFYETALQGVEIFEKQPDLLGEVKKMPGMYKEMFIEYLDLCSKKMIDAVLDVTENNTQIVFINGMRTATNQMIKKILDINIKEETGYSLLSRSQIKNNKIVPKVKKPIDISKK